MKSKLGSDELVSFSYITITMGFGFKWKNGSYWLKTNSWTLVILLKADSLQSTACPA